MTTSDIKTELYPDKLSDELIEPEEPAELREEKEIIDAPHTSEKVQEKKTQSNVKLPSLKFFKKIKSQKPHLLKGNVIIKNAKFETLSLVSFILFLTLVFGTVISYFLLFSVHFNVVLFLIIYGLNMVVTPIVFFLSKAALKRIQNSDVQLRGENMAIATSILSLFLLILLLIFTVAVIITLLIFTF